MSDQPAELPLFPLNAVLMPGGLLPLKVFETRYIDMVRECLRTQTLFGVCLIEAGQEVGAPATPCAVGTSAGIERWDMDQPGLLRIVCIGGPRFRIVRTATQADGLQRATVNWLPEPARQPVPEAMADLLPLLRAVVADAGEAAIAQPHAFDDASWVGYRYCDILPIPLKARQKLLELDDPLLRLSIVREFLSQRGLLKPAG